MAMSKTYYTVNGRIIGEKSGGVRTDYLTDALGSVIGTVNQSAQAINTYRYKPYGAQLAKTGSGADPAFRWVGKPGYRQTGKKYSDVYIRARHDDTTTGRWTTKDPLPPPAPQTQRYDYADSLPTLLTDSLGLLAASPVAGCPPPNCCAGADDLFKSPAMRALCQGGTWTKGACGSMNDHCKNCDDSLRDINRFVCENMLNHLLSLAAVCTGQAPPGQRGNVPDLPAAYTLCCFDGDTPRFCETRCCASGFTPRPVPGRQCAMCCLLQHERTHGQMCLSAQKPPAYGGPGDFPHDEPCGWGQQALCIWNHYRGPCAKYWDSDPRLDVVRECEAAFRARCLARAIGGALAGVVTIL